MFRPPHIPLVVGLFVIGVMVGVLFAESPFTNNIFPRIRPTSKDKTTQTKSKVTPDLAVRQNIPQDPVQQDVTPPAFVPTVNPITQAAVQSGALTCTSRINQIASFLTNDAVSGAYLFFSKSQPDQHVFSASLEIQVQKVPAIYGSASFMPRTNGGCDAIYDTVQFVPSTCGELAKTVFANLKNTGAIKTNIAILDGGTVKIFMMPAGSGCVVIKKESMQ